MRQRNAPELPRAAGSTRRKVALVGLAFAALVAILAFAVWREAPGSRVVMATPVPAPATAPPPVPARPPLSRAEEAYALALWPIHGEVQRSALRMSLGQIFYKTGELEPTELRRRVDRALAGYRRAETRLRALEPPASMRNDHEAYLAAVRLFTESAVEVLKIFDDGRDEHLEAAYPLGLEATNRIREIGLKLWPHEFPAH